MNIILLERKDFASDGWVRLRDRRAEHIRAVLRAAPGRVLRVGLIDGPTGTGTVRALDDREVTLACRLDDDPAPGSGLVLILALPRPKVLKRLWSPLASFAVEEIIITGAQRVEKNYFATHWLAPAAYSPLLRAGLEQAGHTRLPRVRIANRLGPVAEEERARPGDSSSRFYADPVPDAFSLTETPLAARVVLAIGPEGGWVPDERELLAHCGFQPVALGSRPLRSDVACLAALGVLACRRHVSALCV